MKIKTKTFKILFLFFIPLLVYLNSLKNPFIYDDKSVIKENIFIKKISNLKYIFNSNYNIYFQEKTYRPICTLTYFFDYYLWSENPAGWRAFNILLHSVNVLLIYKFLHLFLPKGSETLFPFFTALIFAVHPLNSEIINVVSFREDLLFLFFGLLAILFYFNTYILCLIFFILALLSKEHSIVFPFLILLVEYFFFKINIKRLLPLFIITVIYLICNFFVFPKSPQKEQYLFGSFLITFVTIPVIILKYFALIFFPKNLSLTHSIITSPEIFSIDKIIAGIFIFVIVFLALFFLNKKNLYSFCIFGFFVTFLPVSNLLPVGAVMAERYIYLSSVFIYLSIVYMLTKKIFLKIIFILFVIVLSLRTYYRNIDFKNPVQLWQKDLKTNPLPIKALLEIANIKTQEKNYNEALNYYLQVKNFFDTGKMYLSYRASPIFRGIGYCYFYLGEIQKAIDYTLKAIQINPHDDAAYANLGGFYIYRNEHNLAKEVLKKAIQINPTNLDALRNLFTAFCNTGDINQAKQTLEQILKLQQDFNTILNYSSILILLDELDRAEQLLLKLYQSYPNDLNLLSNLSIIYSKKGDLNKFQDINKKIFELQNKNVK